MLLRVWYKQDGFFSDKTTYNGIVVCGDSMLTVRRDDGTFDLVARARIFKSSWVNHPNE